MNFEEKFCPPSVVVLKPLGCVVGGPGIARRLEFESWQITLFKTRLGCDLENKVIIGFFLVLIQYM